MTPSRAALRQGLAVDVEVGETITLQPGPETRTIVLRVLEKSGRRVRLRVQASEVVGVLREPEKTPV
jgi:hypothetical protein